MTNTNTNTRQTIGVPTIKKLPGIEQLRIDLAEHKRRLRLEGRPPTPPAGEQPPQGDINLENYMLIPSLNLYVAKQKTLKGKNWFQAHQELQASGQRMLTIPEFIEVLKYTKQHQPEIYREITEVRSPWRAEWLDADFKLKAGKLYIHSNHLYQGTELVSQTTQLLDSETLRENRVPGISLEQWLENPTSQGLPKQNIASGNLHYFKPEENDHSVARFSAGSGGAYLSCNRIPSFSDTDLGVRAVKGVGAT
jgi:hypothetical protein